MQQYEQHEHEEQLPVTLIRLLEEHRFTIEELIRLCALRERIRTHPDARDCDIAIRRLEFARWRFRHGTMSDFGG